MQKRILLVLISALVGALAFAGCGDDGGNPTGGGTTDTTPPGIASVTAVDQFHLDVEFDEAVLRPTAERREHYTIVEPIVAARAAGPGDTTWVNTAALDDDGKTVHLTTQSQMQAVDYDLSILGVEDTKGNRIDTPASTSFTGSANADITPPEIVFKSPAAGATDVGIGEPVEVRFSEGMNPSSVVDAFSWTGGGGPVLYEVQGYDNQFVFYPLEPLQNNTTYSVMFDGTAQDWAGNNLTSIVWSYTTTATADFTPPTLTSSSPFDGATNVNVSSNLQLTFSEAVERNSLQEVLITPAVGDGIPVWSNGGRTVTFDPFVDMMPNTQYSLLIPPGGLRDLAGNGNVGAIQVVWSTGPTLESGGFTGTISGPGSADAAGPEGAIVIAAEVNPFNVEDWGIGGTAVVAANGSYSLQHLPDGEWWPICMLDSNDDGEIDPELGDAVGAFGITFDPFPSGSPDSVLVSGGNVVTGVDFELFDPMAFAGTFNYVGSNYQGCCFEFLVGLFDTTGFDINNLGDPVVGAENNWWPNESSWSVNQLDAPLVAGTYYVGAFLDGNGNGNLDGNDPAGFIGGMTPTPFTVGDGTDVLGLSITVDDPAGPPPTATNWGRRQADPGKKSLLRRLGEVVKRATR